jgi:hypothetical protein
VTAVSSHFLDETADISATVAHHRAAHRAKQEPVIDLGEVNAELGEASAQVATIAGDLELLPWRIALGALVLAVVFGAALIWMLW